MVCLSLVREDRNPRPPRHSPASSAKAARRDDCIRGDLRPEVAYVRQREQNSKTDCHHKRSHRANDDEIEIRHCEGVRVSPPLGVFAFGETALIIVGMSFLDVSGNYSAFPIHLNRQLH